MAIAQPSYVSYVPGVTFAGGEVLPVSTREADDFRLTVDGLEAAGAESADLLVLNYPNNPTGAVMPADDLEPVAAFAREHDLLVVTDRDLRRTHLRRRSHLDCDVPGTRDRTVVINGFSKAYAMTGLRLGYALAPSVAVDAMNRVHQYTMLSAPTTAQHAALEALDSCAG
ncbi:MAG: aminotransferase class I/II-fold pyridoxal phosphate-dependent enzyme [Natrialbaceae archaeon]|nr:aminotransferase class I/II-fold pyridoxal phosphate-dependent enzyme [Natrialbaceae archaeon]